MFYIAFRPDWWRCSPRDVTKASNDLGQQLVLFELPFQALELLGLLLDLGIEFGLEQRLIPSSANGIVQTVLVQGDTLNLHVKDSRQIVEALDDGVLHFVNVVLDLLGLLFDLAFNIFKFNLNSSV